MRSRGWSGRSGIRYDVNGQTSGRRGTHDRALAMIDKRTAPSEDLRRLYLPADSGRGCGGGRGGRWWRRLVSAGASAASVPLGAGEHDQPDGQAGERGGHNGDLVCDGNVEHDLLTSPRHHCAPRREQGQGAIGLRPRVIKLCPIRPAGPQAVRRRPDRVGPGASSAVGVWGRVRQTGPDK